MRAHSFGLAAGRNAQSLSRLEKLSTRLLPAGWFGFTPAAIRPAIRWPRNPRPTSA